MKKMLKKYFIPHHENDFKPHFLRETSLFIMASLVVISLLVSLLHATVLTGTSFFASILPTVLVDLTNGDRGNGNLAPLTISPTLEKAAQAKANDMAKYGYFAHTSPNGVTPWFWFTDVGYRFRSAGENLAINFSDSKDVETAWMNSPGHRANILNKDFTEIGIAMAQGIYQGRETTFVVQMFGRPAEFAELSALPTPSPAPIIPTPASTNVAGAEAETIVAQKPPVVAVQQKQTVKEEELKTTAENDMFIAVKNTAYLDDPEVVSPSTESIPHYASWFERVVASPRHAINIFYGVLAFLVSVALVLMVFIEIRKQHPKHIAYAMSLLLLIASAAYINKAVILLHVAVT
ncbi:MAG: hypothetical protein HYW88_03370, partial [Candidatus Sungbacteria bacterium]|nr:hypothetical protein [Candidatus Sungbacteria bacterium]